MKEHGVLKIDKNTIDGFVSLILVLQNVMAARGHEGPLLPQFYVSVFNLFIEN